MSTHHTYRIDADTCDRIGAQFTWGGVDCGTVLRLLELGAHAWERHSRTLVVRHVDDANEVAHAATTFEVRDGNTQGTLAYAAGSWLIVFSESQCWHAHQDFCRVVSAWDSLLYGLYGLTISTSTLTVLICIVVALVWPRYRSNLVVTAVVRALIVAALSSVAFAIVRGCECRFFGLVAAHEVGHILGIGHTDDADRDAVMHPTYYERRTSVCPSAVDVRLLNETLGGTALQADCIDEGPVLTPAGVMCLILAAGAVGYIVIERVAVVATTRLRIGPRVTPP